MEKVMQSLELFERSKKVAPGGVHSPVRSFKGMDRHPIFFKKANGAYLTSVEGKEYIDFCQSFGPLILGHQDPDVKAHVHEMIDTAWTFGACEIYSLELAEWMTQNLPWVERLRFVSSGTEAVMSALRVARAATKRDKILKFDGCYHGHADQLLVKAGSGLAGDSASSSAGVPEAIAAMTLVTPLDDIEKMREVFKVQGKDIAAVIIEPLPANYGLLVQRQEFLKELQSLCQKYGALLIFDEVISGFRTAFGGMVELTGIKPDLVTYGKVIGGGFPVGCYAGRKDLMDLVAPLGDVYQAGTLSANPVGMKAGLKTLQKMKSLDGWNVLNQRTAQFCDVLQKGFAEMNAPVQISHHSSLFWIHGIVDEPIRAITQIPQGQADNFKKIFLKCLDKGIYLAPNAYEVGFISMAHTEGILTQAAEKIIHAAQEVFA
ncbi:MAG: glutamate-1-semialdehyde 2,1-aminomutase [Bdellovibrionaceae bacterium]|nr:glutamate-1-semialdehyde 2,1-aminomutase [Pseudobdellovibrionaceae bacterium]